MKDRKEFLINFILKKGLSMVGNFIASIASLLETLEVSVKAASHARGIKVFVVVPYGVSVTSEFTGSFLL